MDKLIPPLHSPDVESRWGSNRCVLPDPDCVRRLSGGGQRTQPTTVRGVDTWLGNSAEHHLKQSNIAAARCTEAYLREPYKTASERLATAHRACAAVWQTVLDELAGAR